MFSKILFKGFIVAAFLISNNEMTNAQSFGDFGKWIENEVVPTVTGERPLEVKPYISVTHNGEQNFYYRPVNPAIGDNGALRVSYNGNTLQTNNLALREMQIARMLSGDTSVYYEVGADQADQELRRRSYYNEPLYQPQYIQSNN